MLPALENLLDAADRAGLEAVGALAEDLIADLESAFDIQMDTKDVLDLSNYEKGKEVLARYGVSLDE